MPENHSATEENNPSPVTSSRMWITWLRIGLNSFGGGVSTLTLIRRAMVEDLKWVSEEQFTRYWIMVQLAPGINLIALAILIGKKTGGSKGIGIALAGLLLPSVAITILFTYSYTSIRSIWWVTGALRGLSPAIVGIGLMTGMQMARPLILASRKEGLGSLIFNTMILVGSGLAMVNGKLSPAFIVLICAVAGMMGALIRGRITDSAGGSRT